MTRTRTTPARARQRVRKRPIPVTPPFASVMAGAEGSMAEAFATVHTAMNTATGMVLVQLLVLQGKTLEEAAHETGLPVATLRADGLEFVMRLTRALDPDLAALLDASDEDVSAEVARLTGSPAGAHTAGVPGTMI